MAHITLSGALLDPAGEFAVGDQVRFTHKSTTGDTVEGSINTLIIPPDGSYSVDIEYGLVMVEYKDAIRTQFINRGIATVNQDNPATSIPELLNALVPVSSEELIEFQAILADCIAAAERAEAAAATLDLINDLSQAYEFDTVENYKEFTKAFPVGKIIKLGDRQASFTVISGTGTSNGFNIIASDQVSQSIDLVLSQPDSSKAWGASSTNTASQNTAAIQAFVDRGTDGGLIENPLGYTFNLKDIDGSVNEFTIRYWAQDETPTRIYGPKPITNELMTYASNWKNSSNIDVNEWQFAAPYNPGIIINCREDLPKFGTGPVGRGNASLVYRKNNYSLWQERMELDTNGKIVYGLASFERRFMLDLGTNDFTVNPVVGDVVVGNTSAAEGRILTISTTEILITWYKGDFIAGETLTADGTKTSNNPVGAVTSLNPIGRSFRQMFQCDSTFSTINVDTQYANANLQVGGDIKIEDARGDNQGSRKASLAIVDDAMAPTTGGTFDINANGDIELTNSSDGLVGAFSKRKSFTMTVEDAETGGNVGSVGAQSNWYVENGNTVTFQVLLLNVNTSGLAAGNQLFFKGLPFNGNSGTSARSIVQVQGVSITAVTGSIDGVVEDGVDAISIYDNTTTGRAAFPVSAVNSGTSDFFISGTYIKEQ